MEDVVEYRYRTRKISNQAQFWLIQPIVNSNATSRLQFCARILNIYNFLKANATT